MTIQDKWAGKACTLDGVPAKVVGRKLMYAIIRTAKHDVEFSWEAVDRIMRKGGRFKA